MNTSDLTEKQVQAIRVAVAEVAGWSNLQWDSILYGSAPEEFAANNEPSIFDLGNGGHLYEPPNYPASLDAVRPVELALRSKDLEKFRDYQDTVFATCDITVSPLAKCVALLMTLAPEKWEEIKGMEVEG